MAADILTWPVFRPYFSLRNDTTVWVSRDDDNLHPVCLPPAFPDLAVLVRVWIIDWQASINFSFSLSIPHFLFYSIHFFFIVITFIFFPLFRPVPRSGFPKIQ